MKKHSFSLFALVGVILAGAFLTSCFGGKKIFIPEQPNAQTQYKYAFEYRQMCLMSPSADREKEQYPSVIASYEKVIERFPDDKIYTPLAYLDLGDLHFALKDYRKALKFYDQALARYSNMDHVQAYGKLNRGLTLEAMGNIEGAREMYKECIDLYSGHQLESVQAVVRRAKKLWSRVQTEK